MVFAGPVFSAVTPTSGADLFATHCLACHDGGAPKAPHVVMLQVMSPESVLAAMNDGVMKAQSSDLSSEDKAAIAEFLGGRPLSDKPLAVTNFCSRDIARRASSQSVLSWGMGDTNPRSVPGSVSGINRANAETLTLEWAYAFPGATRARSQPTVHQGVVYTGTQNGRVYAIDLTSGCTHWVYQAKAEVRSSVSVQSEGEAGGITLYFGDFNGNVYALDGVSGEARWVKNVEDHPDVTITGSPKLHGDILYVPMSSREWATAADPYYQCCTFRGGVAAFDRQTGAIRWKNYVVGEAPSATGKVNVRDTPVLAPSGAPVWNSPTIDEARGLLYVGTGEAYSSPAHEASDAVVAFDLVTGERRWVHQALAGDAWNMSCNLAQPDNCPSEDGPDFDIGASTILHRDRDGRERLLVGQKSGDVFALDPDADGKLLWKTAVGRGGFYGGVHWGMAIDPRRDVLYAPIADTDINDRFKGERKPGLFALDVKTGEILWESPVALACEEGAAPGCDPGLSAAVTATDGVVFSGALDGTLRAHDSNTGEVIWSYNTARTFDSVSGVPGYGGALESDGPVLVDGSVLINSGYLWGGRFPGNVLLHFKAE
ncbi:MAG: PQQ-binding-like beta-propeller repeat protein [Halieaceae bacterium]|uniref:outer membrane protein assembly factor BamB family protein n=1 Tax=Haliea alexandrii TaxID=2448162 RepID=UPI000F0B1F35|nr:PQQ-binding-like beta-propeller repeat protein [Haliea alexandrii]MCR9186151.1 PQQ-binding-like beta-propeller repeat protein [Halieaceae bacterium]